MRPVRTSDVIEAMDKSRVIRINYLRSLGWAENSEFCPSTRLWGKKMPDGREVYCDEFTAFNIQKTLTPDSERSDL